MLCNIYSCWHRLKREGIVWTMGNCLSGVMAWQISFTRWSCKVAYKKCQGIPTMCSCDFSSQVLKSYCSEMHTQCNWEEQLHCWVKLPKDWAKDPMSPHMCMHIKERVDSCYECAKYMYMYIVQCHKVLIYSWERKTQCLKIFSEYRCTFFVLYSWFVLDFSVFWPCISQVFWKVVHEESYCREFGCLIRGQSFSTLCNMHNQ